MTESTLSFLLIGGSPQAPWARALRQALSTMGDLYAVPEEDAVRSVAESRYDVVMVDAGAVQEATRIVYLLRATRADLRVVVFTSSPTWRRAREAYQAGAVDYVRKSLEAEQIRATIESALELPLPAFER